MVRPMNSLRLGLILGGLSVGLFACPEPSGGRRPPVVQPDSGNPTTDGGDGADAGTDAGATNTGTFTTDAGESGVGLTVNTAVFSSAPFDQTNGPHHLVVLLEDEAERDVFCSGEEPAGNQQWIYVYPESAYAPLVRSYQVEVDATLDVPFTDLSYARAGSGTVTISEAAVGEYAVGSFESAELYDVNNAAVGGAMSGTFRATSCPPQPHFAGSGANSASGSYGFAVAGATTVVGNSFVPYYLVYLTTPDSSAGICAGNDALAPNSAAAILYIPMPETGLPSGTYDIETDGAFVERFDTGEDGYALAVFTSYSGNITVTSNTDNTLTGTYETKLLGHRGQAETLSGTFSAPLCP